MKIFTTAQNSGAPATRQAIEAQRKPRKDTVKKPKLANTKTVKKPSKSSGGRSLDLYA